MKEPEEIRVLSTEETFKTLGVSKSTFHRRYKDKVITPLDIKYKGVIVYRESDVLSLKKEITNGIIDRKDDHKIKLVC